MIYLDYAAATPIDHRALDAEEPYFRERFFNPSASYQAAREVRRDYEEARHVLAQNLGARPAEIVITAGATESTNLAIGGVSGHIVTTNIEHPAVLALASARNATILRVNEKGLVNPASVENAITDETEIVSVGYANSEIGTVQPIKEIAILIERIRADRAIREVATPLLFHTDASQAAGYLDLNVARLNVDLMTLNAGKCYGPKQVGLLYVKAGVRLKPLILGGGQEMGLRSGTENVTGAIGFARALEIAERKRKGESERLEKLRNDLEKFIKQEFPEVIINSGAKQRLPNILNFSVPGLDGERAVFALDERGVLIATGSACAANKGTRSHVLMAIGLAPQIADASLRISLGRPTTDAEISELKPLLAETIRQQLKFGVQQ